MPYLPCPACGSPDAGNGFYCQHCGKPIRATRNTQPAPTPAQYSSYDDLYDDSKSRRRSAILMAGVAVILIVVLVVLLVRRSPNEKNPNPVTAPSTPEAVTASNPEVAPVSAAHPLTAREIAQMALPAVVFLSVEDSNGNMTGFASGFFVSSDLIATNYHVIRNAARVQARLITRDESIPIAGIAGSDARCDLAVLKVGGGAATVRPHMLAMGNSDTVEVGDVIYAVGNPKGLEGTFSQGIVSGFRNIDGVHHIQITAPISPGSSGGPIINELGEVIGIAVGTAGAGQNLNFAIPCSYLSVMMKNINSTQPFRSSGSSSDSAASTITAPPPDREPGEKSPEIPEVARMAYINGVSLENQKRYNEAVVAYMEALRLYPRYAQAYYRLGTVYIEMDMNEQAIDSFNQAIRINSDSAVYYTGLGYAYLKMHKAAEAIPPLKEALRLNPMDGDAHFVLGIAYYVEGQIEQAQDEYTKLKGLNPAYANRLLKILSQ